VQMKIVEWKNRSDLQLGISVTSFECVLVLSGMTLLPMECKELSARKS
jgi:hypothetical protein